MRLTVSSLGIGLSMALLAPGVALGETTTQVTTYVVKVQDEREQTRWTLTEWLRIKERMKMMDVWLALFSDPKKDKFQPELMLNYNVTRSSYRYAGGDGQSEEGNLSGGALKAQLWLTNLISSTIGIRTLNIDLGAEAYHRRSGNFTSSSTTPGVSAASTAAPAPTTSTPGPRSYGLEYYTGDLRIFGRNIQDSSIVLKYGRYSSRNSITDPVLGATGSTAKGTLAGAELQLYVLRSVGAEGNVLQYGDAGTSGGFAKQTGLYYDYLAFIEVSLLRLEFGPYVEAWSLTDHAGNRTTTQERGLQGGLKLQL